MHQPREIHWKPALRILTYIEGPPSKELLYKKHEYLQIEAFQIQIMQDMIENLLLTTALMLEIIWLLRGVRRRMLSHSSAEVKYKVMAHTACEMMWLKSPLCELEFRMDGSMYMYYHNHAAFTQLAIISCMRGPSMQRWTLICP